MFLRDTITHTNNQILTSRYCQTIELSGLSLLNEAVKDCRLNKNCKKTDQANTPEFCKYSWILPILLPAICQHDSMSVNECERWGVGVVICMEQGADMHMAQLITLPLTVSCFNKIQIGFTRVVPDKEPLNGCLWPSLKKWILARPSFRCCCLFIVCS